MCLISFCFINVNVLAPLSVYTLLRPHIYLHCLSCICVFLVTRVAESLGVGGFWMELESDS